MQRRLELRQLCRSSSRCTSSSRFQATLSSNMSGPLFSYQDWYFAGVSRALSVKKE
jgi:hypothetical protein